MNRWKIGSAKCLLIVYVQVVDRIGYVNGEPEGKVVVMSLEVRVALCSCKDLGDDDLWYAL